MIKWLRRHKASAETLETEPLREFVYLDEVSVYSLLTSREGELISEIKETESRSLSSALKSSAGVNVGVRGEIGSQLNTTDVSESQVVRKAIVQSTFRRLLSAERDRLLVRTTTRSPGAKPASEVARLFEDGTYDEWVVKTEDLERGRLLEVTVELEAELIFEMATAIGVVLDVVQANPELAVGELAGINQAVGAHRILEQLLSGLVPLRGRCVDWVHLSFDGQERIVHRSVLPSSTSPDCEVLPVYVVGVAQRDLFWKDIRRVVFSRSRYQVLCRVGRDGTHDHWSPIKLADVFRSLAPDVAREWDSTSDSLMAALGDGNTMSSAVDEQPPIPGSALAAFATELAVRHGGTAADARQALSTLSPVELASAESATGSREAFRQVAVALKQVMGTEIDDEAAAQVRSEILTAAFRGDAIAPAPTGQFGPESNQPARYVDSEIVAIYW